MAKKTWKDETLARIASGELPESIIRYMGKRLREALNDRCKHCSVSDAEVIFSELERAQVRVTDAQARKGADWLYRNVFTPRGQVRNTEFARQFWPADLQVIRDCHENPRFQFMGYDFTDGRGSQYCAALFPIYRCHGANGRFFDYCARPWQAGGNSFLESHA